jgi:hypothetical protein
MDWAGMQQGRDATSSHMLTANLHLHVRCCMSNNMLVHMHTTFGATTLVIGDKQVQCTWVDDALAVDVQQQLSAATFYQSRSRLPTTRCCCCLMISHTALRKSTMHSRTAGAVTDPDITYRMWGLAAPCPALPFSYTSCPTCNGTHPTTSTHLVSRCNLRDLESGAQSAAALARLRLCTCCFWYRSLHRCCCCFCSCCLPLMMMLLHHQALLMMSGTQPFAKAHSRKAPCPRLHSPCRHTGTHLPPQHT